MKKYFILVLLFIATSQSYSQFLKIGPEAGLSIIPVEKTSIGDNYKLGVNAGLRISYPLSKTFSLSSGIMFSQRKQTYSYSDSASTDNLINTIMSLLLGTDSASGAISGLPINLNSNVETKGLVSQTFIDIPFTLDASYENFRLSFGPYFGFMIDATKREEETTTTPLLQIIDINAIDSTGLLSFFIPDAVETEYSEKKNKQNLAALDYGAVFSLNYMMKNINFSFSYAHGLRDYRIKPIGSKVTHKALRVAISYFFDIKAVQTKSKEVYDLRLENE